jgi:DNA-binding NarL/FixJ family response regulator
LDGRREGFSYSLIRTIRSYPRDDFVNEKIRILLVDDSHSFRKGMRALLEIQPDMNVVGEASDGPAGLELIGQFQPDLVLLDAQMPGMDGFEVSRIIKTQWPQTKVILMSMSPDYRTNAAPARVDAFLAKGISPEQLLSQIRETVRRDSEC